MRSSPARCARATSSSPAGTSDADRPRACADRDPACGVRCVIAASFARIFLRNAVNTGLWIVECPEAAADIRTGDVVHVDGRRGRASQRAHGQPLSFQSFSREVNDIIAAGGLMEYVRRTLGKKG